MGMCSSARHDSLVILLFTKMSAFESPNFEERKEREEYFPVPSTPSLKVIGYGTDVHVYQWDRSGRKGIEQSPWALKKMYKKYSHPVITKRIEDEAKILKKMDHPNIVGFRAYMKSETGKSVLAMEECGISLGDLIEYRRENELGPFEPNVILKVILSVCKGLHYLHTEQKIIHGDLKSYNILIKGDFEQIKLCDFGVSYPIGDDGKVEKYVGTLCWSAPEVLQDGPITAKSDIFALGLTIWEMLSLQVPHSDILSDVTYESITTNTPDSRDSESDRENVYGTRPDVPDNLDVEYKIIIDIFKWCTEPEYLNRPEAKDILNLLESNINNN